MKPFAVLNLTGVICGVLTVGGLWAADQKPTQGTPAKKITYEEHILPIFRAKCGACHSADQAKGGLVLDNFGAMMQGGASGEIVVPGDVDASRLYELVSHKGEPFMPPKEPKMPDETLALIQGWIAGGALEKSSSTVKVTKKANALGAAVISTERPAGPPPMPEGLPTDPALVTARGNTVTALAVSPWAPLVAVSGHKQVVLYHTGDFRVVGILPFPEGTAQVLKFSRNGSLLLAGGGRGGQSGRVVVWDVRSGKRAFEVGNEYDAVLAADISSDHSLIALGGPRKIVRVYSTKDGEQVYELKKHTDWVTTLEFSPDGVLLATGDRSNGLFVWEAVTGREFYVLNGHTAALTSMSWRADSNILATSAEDGTVKLWEMNNGTLVKNWGAHSGAGVESVHFARDGRLVSSGRDGMTRLWDQNGAQQRQFPSVGDVGLETVFSAEDERVLTGAWNGLITVWNGKDGAELGKISSNPPALATRIEAARQVLKQAEAAAQQTAGALAVLQKQQQEKQAVVDAASKPVEAAKGELAAQKGAEVPLKNELVNKENQLKALDANLLKAKQAFEQAVKAKTLAEIALKEAAAAAQPAAQKQLDAAVAQQQQALGAWQLTLFSLQDGISQQAVAGLALERAVARSKAVEDKLKQLQGELDKAVAAAKPTPEFAKRLGDADSAAKGAAAKVAQLKQLLQTLEGEKGRTLQTASK